jgi:hypothetical protein
MESSIYLNFVVRALKLTVRDVASGNLSPKTMLVGSCELLFLLHNELNTLSRSKGLGDLCCVPNFWSIRYKRTHTKHTSSLGVVEVVAYRKRLCNSSTAEKTAINQKLFITCHNPPIAPIMASFVKVEYDIKDVKPEKKEKPKKRLGSGRAKQSEPTTTTKAPKPLPFASIANNLQPPANVTPRAMTADSTNQREVQPSASPAKLLRPSSTNVVRRADPADKRKPPDEPWKFSEKGIDRDMLILQQDLDIQAFRHRHPNVYEVPKETKNPHFTKDAIKNNPTISRYRPVPKTSGNILNNSLPMYPFLKTNLDHGIHPARWNVMTIEKDDPDRCKPELDRPGKSHTDFDKSFNSYQSATKVHDYVKVIKERVV